MAEAYSFHCGDIECAVLCEGASTDTAAALTARYPGRSEAEIAAALGAPESESSLNVLYFKSGGKRILVDVGFGESGRPETGQVEAALQSIGIAPADIDLVYLTHFHSDHIDGLFDGQGEPVYSRARYLTLQAEWDEWMARWAASEREADQTWLARMNGLRDRVDFVGAGDEIAPGVSVVELAGHTQGHSGLLLQSQGQTLLNVVDLLHQPFQFELLDWSFIFDTDIPKSTATRRRTLQHCADSGVLTLFYHLAFPGLGRVSRAGDAFQWNPLDID